MNGTTGGAGATGGTSGRRNGHARGGAGGSMGDAQRLRDAEEFELEGLMSEDEEDGAKRRSVEDDE